MRLDVIVVGAGPAGATAAYDLGRRGMRVLLVEKHGLPRDKACGGGVTAKVARLLPFDLSPIIERSISTVDLSWRLKRSTSMRSGEPLVHMVRRRTFDEFLVRHAAASGNVSLADGLAVRSVEATSRGVRIQTERGAWEADFLIGADGANGVVARAMGLMRDRQLMPAVETEWSVGAADADRWSDRLGLDIGSVRGSYGWVFPKGDHLNVGVGCFTDRAEAVRQLRRYDARHASHQVSGPARVLRRVGFVLPLRRPGAAIVRGRVLLAGDAAGLVEGFTGEGIYWAVRSGIIAAHAIAQSSGRENAAGGLACYQARIDAELMPDLVAARRWAQIYIRWPRSCYWMPTRVPAVWRTVEKLLRGERGFSQLRERLGAWGFLADMLAPELARASPG